MMLDQVSEKHKMPVIALGHGEDFITFRISKQLDYDVNDIIRHLDNEMPYALIDGGGLTAPDYRIYDTDGKWVVENIGVTPDIIVDLHPAEMARGYDAQLMKAIEILLSEQCLILLECLFQ